MSRHQLLLPVLIGCASPDLAPNDAAALSDSVNPADVAQSATPVERAAPPVVLTLGPSNLIPGRTFSLTVTGAPPNANIIFARGSATGSTCPPQLGGLCLGLSNPSLLGTVAANAQGIATWNAGVPLSVPVGTIQYFQAVYAGAGATTSPVVSATATALCGDALVQSSEQCDDGNAVAGDGCEPTCMLTPTTGFKVIILDGRIRSTDPQGGLWDDFAIVPPFTNPDPYVEVKVNNFVLGRTVTRDDTFRPNWSASLPVTVNPGESLILSIYDEEPGGVNNELMGTVTLPYNDLQQIRNQGVQTVSGASVTSFRFEVTDP